MTNMRNTNLIIGTVALLLCCLYCPVAAQNGSVVLIYPVEGIAIDGDLSDWPAGMRSYPIDRLGNRDTLKGREDFQGALRVGYQARENALYLAVEVEDESTVADRGMAWEQDGCDVRVNVRHGEDSPGIHHYVIWGHARRAFEQGDLAHVEVEVQRKEGVHAYEWRIDMGKASAGQTRLEPGTIIELGLVVHDQDEDGSDSILRWGGGLFQGVGKTGNILLVEKDAETGIIRRTVRGEGTERGIAQAQIRIQPLVSELLWMTAWTDRQGNYQVEVPAGKYQVSVARGEGVVPVDVTLAGNAPIQEIDFAPTEMKLGRTVPAGPGKVATAGPGTGHWRTYDVTDGFMGRVAWTIFQDRDGYLWFGMDEGGVIRFDGETFVSFTGQDADVFYSTVRSITQDREGFLWFGAGTGAARYDGERFVTFTVQDGLIHNAVNSIIQDREGSLWLGTNGGVSCYDGQQFTSLTARDGLIHNRVNSVFQDREGFLWFGTVEGVSRFDGEDFVSFTTEDGLIHNSVLSIAQDGKGTLWFGTAEGVSHYDGETFTVEDSLPNDYIRSIYSDSEGRMWFSVGAVGVGWYDGGIFTPLPGEGDFVNYLVHSILQDREGSMWFGTNGGVSRYDERLTTFSMQDGLAHHVVHSISHDAEENLWIGTWDRVSKYDGQTFTTFSTEDGLGHDMTSSILQDRQGNIWIGNWSGTLSRYDGRTWTTFDRKDGMGKGWVMSLIQDREGHMWFGTASGTCRYDGYTFTIFTTADGLVNNRVNSVFQDREGSLWFATAGGVSRYDGRNFTSFTTREGLAHNTVNAVFQDREGFLWFGTKEGLNRYDGEIVETFTTDDGLAFDGVNAIFQDREGFLWFGTEGGGVSRYDGNIFTTLTRKDGLGDNHVTSIWEDHRGNLWFGTARGATRFRPPEPFPPPIFIEAVVADQRYEGVSELEIPSSVGVTAFEFRGTSFKTRPEAMIYRYRLQGYDDDWQTTHERRVEYQNLPRGSYTFEVQAVDRDLAYSEEPARVKLEVHLPYERIALLSILGLALGLIAWQTARVVRRDRRLQDANKQLSVAKDAAEQANQAKSRFLANMSHEIRTPMNAILGYAQILRRDAEISPSQRQAVDTIEQSGNHLLTLINEVLDISRIEAGTLELHPVDFDLQKLVQGLDAMFRLRCAQKELAWQVETPPGERLPVRGDEAKLTQVLINLLGNAVKFTDAGRVRLQVTSLPEDRYRFEVIDTGPGISPDLCSAIFEPFHQTGEGTQKGGTGLGLSISQRLVEVMDGHLDLESAPGEGSRFFFSLPLPAGSAEGVASSIDRWARVARLAQGFRVTALVADDVRENREVLSKILAGIGVDVTLADDGRQAIEIIQRAPPDIVFLDIRMPEMSGPEAAQWIWEELGRNALKVVAISASTLHHERQQYLETGFDAFIPKPFRAEQVYACLADLLQVEYDYAPTPEPDGAGAKPLDWSRIRLPDPLLERLEQAAGIYSVTELESHLAEVEDLGTEEQHLAVHMRELSEQFDMNGILDILKEIRHG